MTLGRNTLEETVSSIKSYYVDLEDGYEVGDLYESRYNPIKGEKEKLDKTYRVIRIEAFNQLMEVEEVENSEKI